MKPFNLQEALAGKPVVTRSGRKVTQVTEFDSDSDHRVAAVADTYGLGTFTKAGHYFRDSFDSENDLFMAVTKKTGWLNIYREQIEQAYDGPVFVTSSWGAMLHPSREVADARQEHSKERVDCVQITWEE